jgi:hypothetical protein
MRLNMFNPVINLGSGRWCRKGFDEEPLGVRRDCRRPEARLLACARGRAYPSASRCIGCEVPRSKKLASRLGLPNKVGEHRGCVRRLLAGTGRRDSVAHTVPFTPAIFDRATGQDFVRAACEGRSLRNRRSCGNVGRQRTRQAVHTHFPCT